MNTYARAVSIGEQGELLVQPIMEKISHEGRWQFVEGGPLDVQFQKHAGDFQIPVSARNRVSLELKTEAVETGKVPFEMFSNGNLKGDNRHPATAGCDYISMAIIKANLFLDTKNLFLYPMQILRHRLFAESGYRDFRILMQGKYRQLNDTWLLAIPLWWLKRERVPILRFNLDQGRLFDDSFESFVRLVRNAGEAAEAWR